MDLDRLKKEIEAHLVSNGIAAFHCLSRIPSDEPSVVWDVELHPDFQEFVRCAKALGVKVIGVHERILTQEAWDDVETSIETLEIPHNLQSELSRRLKALEGYVGFLAGIELTFDFEARLYVFETRADFFNEFLEIDDEVALYEVPDFMKDAPAQDDEDDDDDEPRRPSGFFSRN